MMLDPLNALSTLIVGLRGINTAKKEADKWFRFGASLYGTAFVSFTGMWGIGIVSTYSVTHEAVTALVLGLANGLIWCAASVVVLWKKNPEGIPLTAPMPVEQKALEGSFVTTEPIKEKK